ncbi:uncharacterized protein LY89DRAFT_717157 [Mollisia scopiformis]|uniref:Helicase C-terminal domain-containing protein n=1 Tax=Mollisia scopiformis TaxID=149040 RepID=A0A194XEE9_MOLSC|nr:uncharacterized protein LY89DRAFT_717157 [Mollisia scopiformis]KUJ18565.1 hypothetical protein LY89DRAFT_717157 [Mollisia scopiformis]
MDSTARKKESSFRNQERRGGEGTMKPSSINDLSESSFSFKNHVAASSSEDFILDITRYIPVGCLRVDRGECDIPAVDWSSCRGWAAFPHEKDISSRRGGSYLSKELQSLFFNNSLVKPYLGLHYAGWIRLEFKSNDSDHGQIRVYILPDDSARAVVDRESIVLRRALHTLLTQLDISLTTWNGDCSAWFHVDPSLDRSSKEEPSLFEVFNTLPSPKPNPSIVPDEDIRYTMDMLLKSEVPGLKTTMHNYQCRSAALMLQRESFPGQINDPRLIPQLDQNGASWYCDLDRGMCFRDPKTYEAVRGGILAETMGLGKTLICLALILATRQFSSQIPQECSIGSIPVRKTTGSLLEMVAAQIGRTGIPWKDEFSQLEASEGSHLEKCRDALEKGAGHYFLPPPEPRRLSRHIGNVPARKLWLCTTTIVVCPPNLVQQWRSEIEKHTTGLKVLYLRAPSDRLPTARELTDYDIILFSKVRFEAEGKENFDGYQSPLKDLHFKRLIVDEGHSFGNSSTKTMADIAVESLRISARWIVSGTPTQGLGALGRTGRLPSVRVPSNNDSNDEYDDFNDQGTNGSDSPSKTSEQQSELFKQERRDLEKLGQIATSFLQARPWANSVFGNDHASWSQLVMQPRHGTKSRGNMHSLKVTLKGLIVKHKPEDITDDVTLPPLIQKVVYLDGSIQNKLSLNTFTMMIITNAVTSEHKDADYFFHPKQRKHLLQLVSNLRQASFFWSGFDHEHVQNTIKHAKDFLEERKVPVTADDEALLLQAIDMGEVILKNHVWQAISKGHEMPMCVENNFSDDVRSIWSLTNNASNPTLMGATMVHEVQKFVDAHITEEDTVDGLFEAGEEVMKSASNALHPAPRAWTKTQKEKKNLTATKKSKEEAPELAGGVTVGVAGSPKKRIRAAAVSSTKTDAAVTKPVLANVEGRLKASQSSAEDLNEEEDMPSNDGTLFQTYASALRDLTGSEQTAFVDLTESKEMPSTDPPVSAQLVSTASAKLSYLMDRILRHQSQEKILVFYEADNVAFYIAQALECLGIKHLIYAKTLSSARRAQYVVTFNQSEKFRVLLMDVSQAAFGLDISSASRVYFVNPVFSPQVEAQAVKRAHRIGQTKPVYVESLVLKGSIEEVIVKRREAMNNEEHTKCKSILDDQTVYDWIRNARFRSFPSNEISVQDQMAKLAVPQQLFGRGYSGKLYPDTDFIIDDTSSERAGNEDSNPGFEIVSASPLLRRPTQGGKREVIVISDDDEADNDQNDKDGLSPKPRRKRAKTTNSEPEFVPLEVPQEAESSRSNAQSEGGDDDDDDDWLAHADSDEELDI